MRLCNCAKAVDGSSDMMLCGFVGRSLYECNKGLIYPVLSNGVLKNYGGYRTRQGIQRMQGQKQEKDGGHTNHVCT